MVPVVVGAAVRAAVELFTCFCWTQQHALVHLLTSDLPCARWNDEASSPASATKGNTGAQWQRWRHNSLPRSHLCCSTWTAPDLVREPTMGVWCLVVPVQGRHYTTTAVTDATIIITHTRKAVMTVPCHATAMPCHGAMPSRPSDGE
jgi:hypothetical protein